MEAPIYLYFSGPPRDATSYDSPDSGNCTPAPDLPKIELFEIPAKPEFKEPTRPKAYPRSQISASIPRIRSSPRWKHGRFKAKT